LLPQGLTVPKVQASREERRPLAVGGRLDLDVPAGIRQVVPVDALRPGCHGGPEALASTSLDLDEALDRDISASGIIGGTKRPTLRRRSAESAFR
jgi:NADH:ubiquinone oxidoreductase subunit B-like Fe-S oxidoreductase